MKKDSKKPSDITIKDIAKAAAEQHMENIYKAYKDPNVKFGSKIIPTNDNTNIQREDNNG